MRVTIKRKNLRRLASLSALGAGAMAAAVGTAEADMVVVNVNQSVGFDPGFSTAPIKASLPGGAGFSLTRILAFPLAGSTIVSQHTTGCGGLSIRGGPCRTTVGVKREIQAFWRRVSFVTHGVNLVRSGGHLAAFSQNGASHPGFPGFTLPPNGIASHSSVRTIEFNCVFTLNGCHNFIPFGTKTGNLFRGIGSGNAFPGAYDYFHFTFQDNGQTLSGWGQLDVTVGPGVGPDVTLVDYAYETPAAPPPPVPEPSEAVPLALSALVLGAAGIRRWRAAKTS